MQANNFITAINNLISERLLDIHTALPARVVSVNGKTVTVQPTIKHSSSSNYPILHDVPLAIMGGGTGFMSFPIKPGDKGLVIFSERDTSGFNESSGDIDSDTFISSPLGLYPAGFISKIGVGSGTDDIDPDNVVVKLDSSSIILKKNKEIEIGNGIGKIVMEADGTIDLNGLKISPDGKLTDSAGLSFDNHGHRDVQTGEGISGAPVPL